MAGLSAAHKKIVDMVLFAVLGGVLVASIFAFQALPNIHPLGMLIMAYTVVFGWRALIPTYVFVILYGSFYGFPQWWIPYLYIWAVLVAITMALPKRMPKPAAAAVYPIVCALFGLMYGTLYAPAQAIMYGYSFQTTLKWIAAGLPFDAIHAAGNFGMGLLILPVSELMKKLYAKMY